MRAVFLDRDGVINIDRDYISDPKDLRLIRGTVEALKTLQERGFLLIIITNQSGIGRGRYTDGDYKNIRSGLHKRLASKGIKIADEYYCPHTPEENCRCRKPETLMIKQAAEKYGIELERSYFVGDKTSDILAGKRAGLKTILVLTGKAGKDKMHDVTPGSICRTLLDATKVIR